MGDEVADVACEMTWPVEWLTWPDIVLEFSGECLFVVLT
jgi:hypothetical protein